LHVPHPIVCVVVAFTGAFGGTVNERLPEAACAAPPVSTVMSAAAMATTAPAAVDLSERFCKLAFDMVSPSGTRPATSRVSTNQGMQRRKAPVHGVAHDSFQKVRRCVRNLARQTV
jgi:hypothetical protein